MGHSTSLTSYLLMSHFCQSKRTEKRDFNEEILTVEWQRKPNMIMVRAGVRMVPNTMLASPALISAMIIFCAVTSTEHAQQSREPLNSRGVSAASLPPREYGGGTTTPDPALEGEPRSEWACSDNGFSSVPFRDRLIFLVVSAAGKKNSLSPVTSCSWKFIFGENRLRGN